VAAHSPPGGATAVTRHGAQTAMPRPADIAAATGLTWPVR
jgi:hypothetical protein